MFEPNLLKKKSLTSKNGIDIDGWNGNTTMSANYAFPANWTLLGISIKKV